MAGGPPGPRIVAGELGGRRLRSPRDPDVRPSTERTREAIFSMLGPIDGQEVLDLFCGTGALGIEALSRGAARATFVDYKPGEVQANAEALDLGSRAEIVRADAIEFLEGSTQRFDIVLCDPPYRLAARFGPHLDSLLGARLADAGRVIVESHPDTAPLLTLPMVRERRYGNSIVRIHEAA